MNILSWWEIFSWLICWNLLEVMGYGGWMIIIFCLFCLGQLSWLKIRMYLCLMVFMIWIRWRRWEGSICIWNVLTLLEKLKRVLFMSILLCWMIFLELLVGLRLWWVWLRCIKLRFYSSSLFLSIFSLEI